MVKLRYGKNKSGTSPVCSYIFRHFMGFLKYFTNHQFILLRYHFRDKEWLIFI